ncbi:MULTISPECIES: DoxX family membrane protein [Oerskovia]|uniref:DoxX family membrane protein n=2 Tax=Oerskovia TaxID=162491 RepID=A0ABR8V2Z3_9CELL|nr:MULTISPECIES: DoxX family membrane protein [Oerskovia]MBD7999153.1 DoxX family membrane protein [Oerskovia gallyi]MBM7498298.1 putative membrane protein YphA (DoxX/SURF4 family) [Oerskovia paurometabola]
MLLRHVARPMLASWFIYDGVQAALKPAEHVRAARRGVSLVGQQLGVEEPLSEKQVSALVRAHGAATAVAGLFLAVGKAPRTAALTLAALSVPLAVVNQPFTPSDVPRDVRTRKFVANLGAIGAALIAGADYEGRPGVRWRVDRARKDIDLAKNAKHQVDAAKHKVESVTDKATHAVTASTRKAGRTARRAASSATGAVKGAVSH